MRLVTAKHVLEPYVEDRDASLTISFRTDRPFCEGRVSGGGLSLTNILLHQSFDVAVGEVANCGDLVGLRISRKKVPLTEDVLMLDYSSSSVENDPSGPLYLNFSPLTWKGNILRYYVSTWPETKPTLCIDLSFPALQGASGAPVVNPQDFTVVGMIIGSVEQELRPAQVVRIQHEDRISEETRYFLPTAKALCSETLLEVLSDFDIPVENNQ